MNGHPVATGWPCFAAGSAFDRKCRRRNGFAVSTVNSYSSRIFLYIKPLEQQVSSMTVNRRFPLKLACGLGVAIILDTVVQVCWKTAAATIPAAASIWDTVAESLHHPIFI